MVVRRRISPLLLVGIFLVLLSTLPAYCGDDWPPILSLIHI